MRSMKKRKGERGEKKKNVELESRQFLRSISET